MAIISLNKKLGETMGQLLERVKVEHEIASTVSVTYAGRLDPAAEGECLFLTGPDVYKKDEYLLRDKTYTVSVAIGVRTDTDDLLGVVERVYDSSKHPGKNPSDFCPDVIDAFRGLPATIMQAPHEFSSFRLEGKPLWMHTRGQVKVKGKASGAKQSFAPAKKRSILDVHYVRSESVSASDLLSAVEFLCSTVAGDFRQSDIRASWKAAQLLSEFPVLTFTLSVSSGTYIRSLVHTISNDVGVPLVLVQLIRTKS